MNHLVVTGDVNYHHKNAKKNILLMVWFMGKIRFKSNLNVNLTAQSSIDH